MRHPCKKCNLPPYMLSEIKDNANLRDSIPRDIKCQPKCCMEPGEAKPKICFDHIIQEKHIVLFTYPDLRMVIFELKDFPKDIRIEWSEDVMNLEIHYAYSVDDGHAWSRYYEHDEYETFLSLVADAYGKQMDVLVKLRFEAILPDNDRFSYSEQEDPYWIAIDSISVNEKEVDVKSVVVTNANGFNLPSQTQLFDPYANMDNAMRIWEQASRSINHMFGHWAYYFKTDPDDDTRNITLKSYQLHNVVGMKKIKISVPDNEFPDRRNVYSEWGFALPDEFQCHILVDVFEKAFGKGEFPHTHDYIYFPITGYMYNVNAYNMANNFMWKYLWWECTLVKYEDDKTVNKGEYEEETIEYEELQPDIEMQELFEDEIEEGDPTYLNIKLFEAFREKLHKEAQIVEYPLYQDRVKLFDNMYLMSKVPLNDIGVQFDCKHTELSNINITFWVCFERTTPTRKIINCVNSNGDNILYISCVKGVIKVTYGTDRIVSLESKKTLEIDKKYAISLNFSLMYQYMELFIVEYRDDATSIVTDEFFDNVKVDVPLTQYDLEKLQVLGGKHLISNLGLYHITFPKEDILKLVTQVTPDSSESVFFDKAAVPITDNAMNGY